ncbi:MAG: hypothetical protein HOJ64_00580 [Euryarchaeota archaeon]|jgi:hypothetical protein|nr:hypothetical protein [Euryarchaeota archaeon]MBT4392312.1 hypothetical protein [Euryarchaeota archaeon]MBT4802708.1 hypothetical protein [Euryarchaeota archaeon]MBT5613353.1 hypothetical protein [Euryarchaeota archaeon]MBT6683624.1 hypothetical protein [Euryarchaeota archaeon]
MSEITSNQTRDEIEDMDLSNIKSLKQDLINQLEACEQEFRDLVEDRRNQIDIVKTLRNALKEVESMDDGRRELLKEFHGFRKAAEIAKNLRDKVNKLIPPPSDILEKWIEKTHNSLTTIPNDLTELPTLPREKDIFKRFFELQVCIIKKKECENAHLEYVINIGKLREVSKKLDLHREEKEKNISEITNDIEVDENSVSRKDVRKISKKITGIDKKLDSLKEERSLIRDELNKIKILIKQNNSKVRKISINEVKEKIKVGSSLDASEFEALLHEGNLSGIGSINNDKNIKLNKKPNQKKKMRKLGSTQRKSRRGNTAALREND